MGLPQHCPLCSPRWMPGPHARSGAATLSFSVPSPFTPAAPPRSLSCVLGSVSLSCLVLRIPPIREALWCLSLSDWLPSPSAVLLPRPLHAVADGQAPSCFAAAHCPTVRTPHSLAVRSPADGRSGGFPSVAVVNNAAGNVGVDILVQISVSGFFGYISRSGIAGS